MKLPASPEPLAPKDLALLINRSERWVRRQCHAGKIKVLPVGVPYRIPRTEAERFLQPSETSRKKP